MARLRPVLVMPDPWMALDLLSARPELPTATFGGSAEPARFAARDARAVLVPPGEEEGTAQRLMEDRGVQAMLKRPSWLISSATSARFERSAAALKCRPAFVSAAVIRALQGRRRLADIAALGGVLTPTQRPGLLRPDASFAALAADLGDDVVIQGPRHLPDHASFRVRSEAEWLAVRSRLGGQPVRVARYIEGRPAAVVGVLDTAGRAVLSPVLATARGVPGLTDRPLGTCGDDFTWRGQPDPGEAPLDAIDKMGKWLGKAGFRGAARFDFVVRPDGEAVLVGFDPRLDATFCLLCARKPDVLTMLIRALEGDALPSRRMAPIATGLASVFAGDAASTPLARSPEATELRPVPWRRVGPGRLRGRWRISGTLVDESGGMAVGGG